MDSDFCTCEEGEGYELVDVRHRESPPLLPQGSELEGDIRGSLGPRFPLSTPTPVPTTFPYDSLVEVWILALDLQGKGNKRMILIDFPLQFKPFSSIFG